MHVLLRRLLFWIREGDLIHCELFLSYGYMVEALSPSCRFSQSAQLIFWVGKKQNRALEIIKYGAV